MNRTFERSHLAPSTADQQLNLSRVRRTRVLVIDSDLDALELISFNLVEAGFEVSIAVNGAEGRYKAQNSMPHLVVLNVSLPDVDGFQVCRQLRSLEATRELPIILVSARSSEADRISGFEIGANDFVSQPFSPRELLLRIRNIINTSSYSGRQEQVLEIGDLRIDLASHSVTFAGESIALTLTEFRLLRTLAQQNGRVQSRESLLAEVWEGDKSVDPRTVDTHMARLREKLGKASAFVGTVYGVGYRFMNLHGP